MSSYSQSSQKTTLGHPKGDSSPPRKQHREDNSPPRKSRNSDLSPRRSRNSNLSPRRRQIRQDNSPPRRSRNSDLSPPRRQNTEDNSPPRRSRNSDLSPPQRQNTEDNSPPRRSRNSDLSPPQRQNTEDNSPPRRSRNSDLSPPRRQIRQDNSPPRRNQNSDLSPPRRQNRDQDTFQSQRPERLGSEEMSKPKHDPKIPPQSRGVRSGLLSAESMGASASAMKEHQRKLYESMDPTVLGRDAETIFRDKASGRRLNIAEEQEKSRERAEKEQQRVEKYSKLGRGLLQTKAHQQKLAQDVYEASKPLARFEDDADRDAYLKGLLHTDDPMYAYFQQQTLHAASSIKRRYEGPAAPMNRFGIQPGYRWDGVDRSNGFEKELFQKQNAKKALDNSYIEWSNLEEA